MEEIRLNDNADSNNKIIVTFLQHVSFNNLIKAYYNKKLFITKHEYLGRPQMINRTSNYA